MEFCQICGTRLRSSPSQPNTLVCPKCGYTRSLNLKDAIPPRGSRLLLDKDIVVVDEDKEVLVQPTVRAECPKCMSKKAHCRTIEVGDEEETVEVHVFKCTQCGYTWREKG